MAPRLYIAFTMDCERSVGEFPNELGGPDSWDQSEKAIYGFSERLLGSGIPPTLFLTPECAQRQGEVFRELSKRGVEMGLHIHPQTMGNGQYSKYLGQYDYQDQKEIIGEGSRIFQEAIGKTPKSFRPGNFSADDNTFPVLHSLEFEQGSVSDPGREVPCFAAEWKDTSRNPHWTNEENRLEAGALPLLEVPVTTDPSKHHPNGFPYELRIEHGEFEVWHLPIVNRALREMEDRSADFQCLCLFTHNCYRYDREDTDHTRTLMDLIGYLGELKEKYELVPGTLTNLRKHYVDDVGLPGGKR